MKTAAERDKCQEILEERYKNKGLQFNPSSTFQLSMAAIRLEDFKNTMLVEYVRQNIITEDQSDLLYKAERARLEKCYGFDVEDFHYFDPKKADMFQYNC